MNAKYGKQKWENDIGEKIVGTAMAKGMIFTGTGEGIYAIDKETGRIRWEQLVGDVTSDPVIADDEVIVGCSNGNVYSFKVDTGTIEWLQDFVGPAHVSKGSNNKIHKLFRGVTFISFSTLKFYRKIWFKNQFFGFKSF